MTDGAIDHDFDDAETQRLFVGDHVVDRDDPDATLLVTGISPQRASEFMIRSGKSVADVNPDYPKYDRVIEVVYPQRTDAFIDNKSTYAFPVSRLDRVEAIHDLDDDDGSESDDV